MKKLVALSALFAILFSGFVFALWCGITQTCNTNDVVFKIFTNDTSEPTAAELWNGTSNYGWKVCCNDTTSNSRTCNGNNGVINLSQPTGAHVEFKNETNYPFGVCYGNLNCSYKNNCGSDICMASILGSTNADIGTCEDGYPLKICCRDTASSGCVGVVNGTVRDTFGEAIGGASIEVRNYASVLIENKESTFAGPTEGRYITSPLQCGSYIIKVTAEGHVISSKPINVFSNMTLDFSLIPGDTCEQDCTHADDNVCYADCHNDVVSNCSFYNGNTTEICNLRNKNFLRSYNESYDIVCCTGEPKQREPKIKAGEPKCGGKTNINIKIGTFNDVDGIPKSLYVSTCSQ